MKTRFLVLFSLLNVVKKELNALCIDVAMLTREELEPTLDTAEPAFSIEG